MTYNILCCIVSSQRIKSNGFGLFHPKTKQFGLIGILRLRKWREFLEEKDIYKHCLMSAVIILNKINVQILKIGPYKTK